MMFRKFAPIWVAAVIACGMFATSEAQAGRRWCQACPPVACAQPCAAPAVETAAPQTITKKVMVPVVTYKTMTVPVVVYKPVTKTKTVTLYKMVAEKVEVKKMVTVMVPETKTRTEEYVVCTPEWKEVSRDVTVMVPTTETKSGVRKVCKPVMVTETRMVCKDEGAWQCKSYVDNCGCTRTCKVWVPSIVKMEVPMTVCKMTMVEEPYTCEVTVCKPTVKTITEKVCSYKRETKSREVSYTVCSPKEVEKTFYQTVCKKVPFEKEVSYCEMEAVNETREVQVPETTMVEKEVTYTVGGCADAGCSAPVCTPCRARRRCW